ncbi:MAG: Na+/H+ antiporter NhaC family protein, partial [Lachnospiraceae bacterium]|nr:Na+/H+ antiporter NhaC family protein [Lachnospiraceae bacterium]
MESSMFIGTVWSILPPIIAIVLALITKEVYSSLLVGIAVGALMVGGFNPWASFNALFDIMKDSMNLNILIFDILLGMIIVLMTKSGGSAAYGKWAGEKIKSKKTSLLATMGLGILIFVDDYFNCLTVGSVMRPVTDRYKVSRAKLAYIIDATA